MIQQQASPAADSGDYLKAFACTAVMAQTVLSMALTVPAGRTLQTGIAGVYLAIKFTAPAFICGIVMTTMRVSPARPHYGAYLRQQWSALGLPTLVWSLAYLLLLPQLQQHTSFHSLGQFGWQLINGNAAPHLWYNTMMLQIIVLMPLWWALRRGWPRHHWAIVAVTAGLLLGWLAWYNGVAVPSGQAASWYGLDRVWWGFAVYAIVGIGLATSRTGWLRRYRWLGWALLGVGTWLAQYRQLRTTGSPIDLDRSSYYLPATVGYSLCVILLVVSLAKWHQAHHSRWLPIIHWLATYAYPSYLANVFWLELIWLLGGRTLTASHPVLGVVGCYLATWCWSFAATYGLHLLGQRLKGMVRKWRQTRRTARNRSNW
ncbi:acyltransferase [Levilactobacillus suantsaiihabitans]|uniref:Acyltransferase n=1 Tax=Levilactobacillus suantsaiihabitans TaxID=2487722 RepID=A0A4Z0J8R4_9LACO|nr:acyltransferase [Levilactobacillus suantsaiihabitans]TGD19025.1 acyltransferase [Levilactobacillus suantsaiihabitans]